MMRKCQVWFGGGPTEKGRTEGAAPRRRPTLRLGRAVRTRWRLVGRRQRGAALIETALVIPVVLALVFGVIGVDRLIQARIGVSAVAHEAARSAALANNAAEASQQGMARAQEVAAGYQLSNGSLKVTVNPGSFQRGGEVQATAQYDVPLQDLPLLKWTHLEVTAQDQERIDLYRSRWQAGNPS